MTRKTRSQRHRAAARRASGASGGSAASNGQSQVQSQSPSRAGAKRGASAGDPLAFYRSLAAPSMRMRLVLVAGLACYTAAQAVALANAKSVAVAGDLALLGMVGILVFLGSGFVRHQRALFRIRREAPEAWQNSMRFALSTMPIPLGFGGRPSSPRERAVRWLTLLLLLAFALTAIAGGSKR